MQQYTALQGSPSRKSSSSGLKEASREKRATASRWASGNAEKRVVARRVSVTRGIGVVVPEPLGALILMGLNGTSTGL